MALYEVTKVWQYTEIVTVEADDREDAESKAYDIEGSIQNDDMLYEVKVKELSE